MNKQDWGKAMEEIRAGWSRRTPLVLAEMLVFAILFVGAAQILWALISVSFIYFLETDFYMTLYIVSTLGNSAIIAHEAFHADE